MFVSLTQSKFKIITMTNTILFENQFCTIKRNGDYSFLRHDKVLKKDSVVTEYFNKDGRLICAPENPIKGMELVNFPKALLNIAQESKYTIHHIREIYEKVKSVRITQLIVEVSSRANVSPDVLAEYHMRYEGR